MQKIQGIEWSSRKEHVSEVARMLLGVILFILVIGIWVYLWVPPLSPF